MAVYPALNGFPPIIRLKFFQGSKATPGRCIVDTMLVGPTVVSQLPRHTSLTLNTTNFAGTWTDMRVVKAPRARRGYLRVVLQDSRWKLRDTVLSDNWNERDSLGNVLTEKEKTYPELIEYISEQTGIDLQVRADVPAFKPTAKWTGVNAEEALNTLLLETGTRCVYDPIQQIYFCGSANTGTDISSNTNFFASRHHRPGPPAPAPIITVRSAPILYEDTIDCQATQINLETGAAEDQAGTNLPTSPTEEYGQTAFRLWRPKEIDHPGATDLDNVVLLDHRAKAHLFDPKNPMHERARIVRDEYERYPHHEPLYTPSDSVPRLIELTGGGRAFLTDHPVLISEGGTLHDECKVVTSYYIKEATGVGDQTELKREEQEIILSGTGTEPINYDVEWIKPVDSTLPDMTGSVWTDVLVDVSNAIRNFFAGEASVVRIQAPVNLNGSGMVGAVSYEVNNRHNRSTMFFHVAINFTPGAEGSIH